MDREEVIRMAREAGVPDLSSSPSGGLAPCLERFASLVAAAERERAAKVALDHECGGEDDFICRHQNCGLCISGAIRALKD